MISGQLGVVARAVGGGDVDGVRALPESGEPFLAFLGLGLADASPMTPRRGLGRRMSRRRGTRRSRAPKTATENCGIEPRARMPTRCYLGGCNP
eukprot:8610317-Pyramimonas_sp.AAC.1